MDEEIRSEASCLGGAAGFFCFALVFGVWRNNPKVWRNKIKIGEIMTQIGEINLKIDEIKF
jgi:hypothetical protein